MAYIGQFRSLLPIAGNHKGALPVIPQPSAGIFHGETVKKSHFFPEVFRGNKWIFLCAHQIRKICVIQFFPIIYMAQIIVVCNSHHITAVRSIQFNNFCCFIKCNQSFSFRFPVFFIKIKIIRILQFPTKF